MPISGDGEISTNEEVSVAATQKAHKVRTG